MSLLNADLLKNRSELFKETFLPVRYLFDDKNEDTILAVCRKTIKTVSVEVYYPPHKYCVPDFIQYSIKHPNLTSLIHVVPDEEAGLFYAVSESPSCYTLKTFAKYVCKTHMDVRRNLHTILKALIPLFMELYNRGFGVSKMNEHALILNSKDGIVEVKLRREMIDVWPSQKHAKNNLIAVAQLFSNIYADVTDGSKLLTPEMAFFRDCMDDRASLKSLHASEYFNCDPNEWKDDDFADWKEKPADWDDLALEHGIDDTSASNFKQIDNADCDSEDDVNNNNVFDEAAGTFESNNGVKSDSQDYDNTGDVSTTSDDSFELIDEIPDEIEIAQEAIENYAGNDPVEDILQPLLYDVSALIQNTVSAWRLW